MHGMINWIDGKGSISRGNEGFSLMGRLVRC